MVHQSITGDSLGYYKCGSLVLQVWFIEVLQVVHWVTTSTAGGSLGYYRCGSLRYYRCGSSKY